TRTTTRTRTQIATPDAAARLAETLRRCACADALRHALVVRGAHASLWCQEMIEGRHDNSRTTPRLPESRAPRPLRRSARIDAAPSRRACGGQSVHLGMGPRGARRGRRA